MHAQPVNSEAWWRLVERDLRVRRDVAERRRVEEVGRHAGRRDEPVGEEHAVRLLQDPAGAQLAAALTCEGEEGVGIQGQADGEGDLLPPVAPRVCPEKDDGGTARILPASDRPRPSGIRCQVTFTWAQVAEP